ncbi:hypothetical protein [Chryseobacterium lathyri]|uniref:DUF4304 domain-containing protein n=1 Tax=Chryseobacterium lathyri TaxID=395933 RepID=A0A511Y7Y7_9FLAO|nr:hypothetical protein [Chryseobacterium lathyri]GEN71298.1 hypothetical protein CLA01_13700 [Chryseobacterium lathyri]
MDNKTKKIIKEEWLSAFPGLSAFSQNKLYKIIGPAICGIELINLPRSENYRPHFVIYPLYKADIKSCLAYPVLMFEFYNGRNLQLDLPYNDVNEKLKEAIQIVSDSLQLSLEDDVPLNSFYNLIDDVQKYDSTYQSATASNASLLEFRFYLALYAGSESQIQSTLDQIERASKNWNLKIFEAAFGDFGAWFQKLQHVASNKDFLLKQVEANKLDKKISQLASSDLTL